jgi:hypothetical protein
VKSLFQQEALKRGIFTNGAHLITFSHTAEDIRKTLVAYEEALKVVAAAAADEKFEARLEGRPLQPVFRPVS